jgi:hypothetical protein
MDTQMTKYNPLMHDAFTYAASNNKSIVFYTSIPIIFYHPHVNRICYVLQGILYHVLDVII